MHRYPALLQLVIIALLYTSLCLLYTHFVSNILSVSIASISEYRVYKFIVEEDDTIAKVKMGEFRGVKDTDKLDDMIIDY